MQSNKLLFFHADKFLLLFHCDHILLFLDFLISIDNNFFH